MQVEYRPHQVIKLAFASNELINIRITVNGVVKVIQCRNSMTFVAPVDLQESNTITVENLTANAECIISALHINFLDITDIAHEFVKTYTKIDNVQIGDFVADLYSPDIAVISMGRSVYATIMPYFKKGIVNMVPQE